MRRIGKFFYRPQPSRLFRVWIRQRLTAYPHYRPRPGRAARPAVETPPSSSANGRADSDGYGPNMATLMKLEKLRALRRDSIRGGRVTLSWTAACRQAPIDPKTARHRDPELRAHWDDPGYP